MTPHTFAYYRSTATTRSRSAAGHVAARWMRRCRVLILSPLLLLFGCASGPTLEQVATAAGQVLDASQSGVLSDSDIAKGLREALTVGSSNVVAQLGQADGFYADPAIRVPLPRALQRARSYASKVGLEGSFDDLELRLNRAAEQATPKAKALFMNAIRSMTLDDARGILSGPDDAATRYFETRTADNIRTAMRPLVEDSLSRVGAVRAFGDLLTAYQQIPLAPKVNADLNQHVVDAGVDGIFKYLATEEKAIRENPLKRTSALLRRVFAAQ